MMLHFRKVYLIISCILLFTSSASAQRFLIPETALVQHAGSIGFLSAGIGYNLFPDNNGSLDITYGLVPKSKGGRQDILAAKFAYRPFNIGLGKFGTLDIANPGMFVSYHPGGKFHTTFDKDQYPDGYYWWSSAIRIHLSASTELKINIPKRFAGTGIEKLSLYGEFNTNDLYAVSWFKNREHLAFPDIFKLGLGMKVYF